MILYVCFSKDKKLLPSASPMTCGHNQGLSHALAHDLGHDQGLSHGIAHDISQDQALHQVLTPEETNYKIWMSVGHEKADLHGDVLDAQGREESC